MSVLSRDISAFEHMRPQLEARHPGGWVLFYRGAFVEAFADFETAASTAVERFDAGPYLIRQLGAARAVQLPGGMTFTPSHAVTSSRL
ncbi:hypothetical protein [Brevundimonas sp.]|uniref:hypothetical protein n=1 Tax=Brevundimonas sp. TaxID=1871086 RepID=UPI00248934F2|nr:hypothetical protein [Brevundimonas sp.]MDI1279952.1 hypothetical protein [Brevundimonas sp.]